LWERRQLVRQKERHYATQRAAAAPATAAATHAATADIEDLPGDQLGPRCPWNARARALPPHRRASPCFSYLLSEKPRSTPPTPMTTPKTTLSRAQAEATAEHLFVRPMIFPSMKHVDAQVRQRRRSLAARACARGRRRLVATQISSLHVYCCARGNTQSSRS
jgi:hypothetical protein